MVARDGVRVAPFKAQNMSNNARVVGGVDGVNVASGGEIGVAQWLQAKAAMIEPDVRMNPVLLKPEADTRSQVIVRGIVDRELTNTPWDERHDALWTPMAESYDSLAAEFDLIIIEGAGSPAEINLRDQVNNRMIEYADASGLLLSDIDRGGSFAHLYGTWALVPDATRTRLDGFILNRFRGDTTMLAPGPQMLTDRTGMACAGVMPMLAHRLPREEGATEFADAWSDAPTVVLPRLPYGSNLDEFHLLAHAANVRWVTRPAALDRLDPTFSAASNFVRIGGAEAVQCSRSCRAGRLGARSRNLAG
jgi:adenosylcobyric acid synthase